MLELRRRALVADTTTSGGQLIFVAETAAGRSDDRRPSPDGLSGDNASITPYRFYRSKRGGTTCG